MKRTRPAETEEMHTPIAPRLTPLPFLPALPVKGYRSSPQVHSAGRMHVPDLVQDILTFHIFPRLTLVDLRSSGMVCSSWLKAMRHSSLSTYEVFELKTSLKSTSKSSLNGLPLRTVRREKNKTHLRFLIGDEWHSCGFCKIKGSFQDIGLLLEALVVITKHTEVFTSHCYLEEGKHLTVTVRLSAGAFAERRMAMGPLSYLFLPQELYTSIFPEEWSEDRWLPFHTPPEHPHTDGTTKLFQYQRESVDWMLRIEEMVTGGVPFVVPAVVKLNNWLEKRVSCALSFHPDGSTDFRSSRFVDPETAEDQMEVRFKGGVLADEMGMGKTMVVLSVIKSSRRPHGDFLGTYRAPVFHKEDAGDLKLIVSNASLLVCPSYLVRQWSEEIQKFYPELRVTVLLDQKTFSSASQTDLVMSDIVVLSDKFPFNKYYNSLEKPFTPSNPNGNVHLGSVARAYDNLERETLHLRDSRGTTKYLSNFHWHRLIVDEGHVLLSEGEPFTYLNCLEAKYRWCVSGTPFVNNVLQKRIFSFLDMSVRQSGTVYGFGRNQACAREEIALRPEKPDVTRGVLLDRRIAFPFIKGDISRHSRKISDQKVFWFRRMFSVMFNKLSMRHTKAWCSSYDVPDFQQETVLCKMFGVERSGPKLLSDFLGVEAHHVSGALGWDEQRSERYHMNESMGISMLDKYPFGEKSMAILGDNPLPINALYLKHLERVGLEIIMINSLISNLKSFHDIHVRPNMANKGTQGLTVYVNILPRLRGLVNISCGARSVLEAHSVLSEKIECFEMARSQLRSVFQGLRLQLVVPEELRSSYTAPCGTWRKVELGPYKSPSSKTLKLLRVQYGSEDAHMIYYIKQTLQEEKEKLLVFSSSPEKLSVLRGRLLELGIEAAVPKGNVYREFGTSEKGEKVRSKTRVMLMSLIDMKPGIALTVATQVLFLDKNVSFDHRSVLRAIGRAHRQGQDKVVKVVSFTFSHWENGSSTPCL